MEKRWIMSGSPWILVNKITSAQKPNPVGGHKEPRGAKDRILPDRCTLFREDRDRYEIYERITSPPLRDELALVHAI